MGELKGDAVMIEWRNLECVDSSTKLRDNLTMSIGKVDSKKRIVLPGGQPGDVFDIQQQEDGRFLFVRLQKPEVSGTMSVEACLEAMDEAPLLPTMSWEDLRQLMREP